MISPRAAYDGRGTLALAREASAMDTLPRQVPGTGNPYTWFCAHCAQPSNLWDWDWAPWPEPTGAPLPPVLCTNCVAKLKYPEVRDAKRNILTHIDRRVRTHAELTGGTIITWTSD